MKKKSIVKLYCNTLYFLMITSAFSNQHHSITLERESRLSYNNCYVKDFDMELEEFSVNPLTGLVQNLPSVNNIVVEAILAKQSINEYSGMNLSHELEDDIKRVTEQYNNIPYQIILTIGYRESAGNWNNNGVISSTNDYGMFQINECNLSYIEENLGYSKEEILNDPIKNAEACLFLLNDIVKREDVTTLEDIFGMYNGWVNWQEKPQSVEYVKACMEIMNTYFPDYQYEKEQIIL